MTAARPVITSVPSTAGPIPPMFAGTTFGGIVRWSGRTS